MGEEDLALINTINGNTAAIITELENLQKVILFASGAVKPEGVEALRQTIIQHKPF